NGTVVNGSALQVGALRPGDRLTVGPVTFELQYAPEELRSPTWSPDAAREPPGLVPLDAPAAEAPATLNADAAEAPEIDEKPKKKKKKKKERREASPDYSIMMKDEGPYEMPHQDNIRDLLSQLEDEAE